MPGPTRSTWAQQRLKVVGFHVDCLEDNEWTATILGENAAGERVVLLLRQPNRQYYDSESAALASIVAWSFG